MHYHVLPIGKCSWHVHRKEVLTAIPHGANLEEELQELGQRGSYLHDEKANACLKGKKSTTGTTYIYSKVRKISPKWLLVCALYIESTPTWGFAQ